MHIESIAELTFYLSSAKRSLDDICRYLVLHTFSEHSARAIYLGQVESDGHLVMKSSFGFEKQYISQWNRIPLTLNIPIVEAVRNSSDVLFLKKDEFFDKYPQVNSLGTVDKDWESCIASAIQANGAYMLVLNTVPKISGDFKCFMQSVGHLISLHLDEAHFDVKGYEEPRKGLAKLTPRQELICSLLVKGFTNPHIAQEIGYSESLVRQETIAIYSAMRVSGRKELMNLMENQKVMQE